MPVVKLDDPRVWPSPAMRPRLVFDDAQRAIDAGTAAEADAADAKVRGWLAGRVSACDGDALASVLTDAPSAAAARHLRRLLADIERDDRASADGLRNTLFAIPVILVAALEASASPLTLDGIVPNVDALAAILRDARAFAGCETFTLSSSLVATRAIDVAALPSLLARGELANGAMQRALGAVDLPPGPIRIEGTAERVHLRFIAGALLTPPHTDPLVASPIGRWGTSFARELAKALAAGGLSLLALPRPPQRLVGAIQSGRAAQREVSAQLFASNAIRAFRRSLGEPTAIISAHRAADAPGGGELRLSLSSPFAPKAAEGFRCPIYPYESVQEASSMLEALVRDCRVSDVRFAPGIHPDIDPLTRGPLFFKDDTELPDVPMH
jgi:hypothetical protein